MAKGDNVVTAFVWACNILDTQTLTLAEQAILFNLLKLINRNFWKPIKITAYKLAQSMGSDHRTIEKNLRTLEQKGVIYREGDEIYIGNDSPDKIRAKFNRNNTDGDNKPAKSKSEHTAKNNTADKPTDGEIGTLADFI